MGLTFETTPSDERGEETDDGTTDDDDAQGLSYGEASSEESVRCLPCRDLHPASKSESYVSNKRGQCSTYVE